MKHSPSPRLKAEGNPELSPLAAHTPLALSQAIQCSQMKVAFPSASHVNEPSARSPLAWAMEEYPFVPSLTRASPTDTSIVPVVLRMSFASSKPFTVSLRESCQNGSFGFAGPLAAVLVRASLPSRRRVLGLALRGPKHGPPPGAVTLTAFALPLSSWPISNSTSHPSSWRK